MLYFDNLDKYDGEWKSDLKHGQGVFEFANRESYSGNWENGERCG